MGNNNATPRPATRTGGTGGFPAQGSQTTGLYYGSHYAMDHGNEQPTQGIPVGQSRPEVFGFGNAPPQPPARPQVQHTTTIRSDINLKKDTLRLVKIGDDDADSRYGLTFNFDAAAPCNISIFFVANEIMEADGKSSFTTLIKAAPAAPLSFPKGLGQLYTQPAEQALNLAAYKDAEVLFTVGKAKDQWPVVIAIETVADADTGKKAQAQYTFAILKHNVDGSYSLKVLRQKIVVNGQAYILQEIYGIESENGLECVVCMSDPRDTTVLPCRHMCLCAGCAEELRSRSNKCPICRAPYTSLLQIKVKQKKTSATEGTTESAGAASPPASSPAAVLSASPPSASR